MIRSRVRRLPKLTRHRLPKSSRLVPSFLTGSLVWQPARRAAFSGEGKMEWKSDHGIRRLGDEVRLRRRLEGPSPLLAHRPRQPGRQVGGRASAVLRAGVKPRPEPAQDVETVPRDRAEDRVHDRRHQGARLAVGAEAELPPDGRAPDGPFRDVVVHGDLGMVDEHAQPLAVVQQRAQGLGLRRGFRKLPQLALGFREQRGDRALQLGLRRLEPRRREPAGIEAAEPDGVQPVDLRDPVDPFVAPLRQLRPPGRALQEIAPGVSPAEAQDDEAGQQARQLLVRAVAVADQIHRAGGAGEQLLGDLGAARAVDAEPAASRYPRCESPCAAK